MPEEIATENKQESKGPNGYRISNGPVVRLGRNDSDLPSDLVGVVELPRVYGAPLLLAVARNPRTLFVYWNIDWSTIFETSAPVDRQVHLRVVRADGTEELTHAVEPMAGNCYLTVTTPGGRYRVEIGYFQPERAWRSVAISEEVTMPQEAVTGSDTVDVATIPFHLSFQRLIDSFRGSNKAPLSEIVSRLQQRAASDEERALLTHEEWEILRAMNLSADKIETASRAFGDRQNANALRRRAETLLGFGASSPSRTDGSSWA